MNMTEKTIRMQAKMLAYVAEIEAVKATIKGYEAKNATRAISGMQPAYSDECFFNQKRELWRLAKSLRENI